MRTTISSSTMIATGRTRPLRRMRQRRVEVVTGSPTSSVPGSGLLLLVVMKPPVVGVAVTMNPQRVRIHDFKQRKSNVGADLSANEVCQITTMWAVMASSRTSPLLHDAVPHRFVCQSVLLIGDNRLGKPRVDQLVDHLIHIHAPAYQFFRDQDRRCGF